ncbi:sensor histidine kinase [Altererythrobacter sp. B11]|uniref:sensor histidine kinase n=1 Tax=Altererythrobacter sp. B11 TaxID=2060312 RepID=UPI0015591D0F|nr:ATP-binding protein [Altererythrobacter sp. B11]
MWGSLLLRVAAILVLGLGILQLAILLAVIWPDGRPATFRLVNPTDVREIAETLEAAPPDLRERIARAASVGGTTVELLSDVPAEAVGPGAMRDAPRLNARFREFASELKGRELLVQVRHGRGIPGADAPAGPMRVLVRLHTGEVVAIERAPLLLRQIASRYNIIAGAAAMVIAALLLVLWLQIIRPISRLAGDARSLRYDGRDQDLPLTGGPELRDLTTALNAMKRRIAGLVEERTAMLAAIAHDLRTYLTRLRLRAEFIEDQGQRERAQTDVSEMAALIEDILLFAKTESQPAATICVIDAREELLTLVDLHKETGAAVTCEVPTHPLPCRCNPLAFRRIVGNLIDNAIKYGKTAQVSLQSRGARVAVRVIDSGPGVPDEMIESLPRPFVRVEGSRGRHSGGAGLGLAIVKALAESHGGSLSLRNRPGGGFEAVVTLPAAG